MTNAVAPVPTTATPAPAWPRGFRSSGVAAGIKKPGLNDLALLVTDAPASAAAVFTRNLIAAAPIGVSRAHLGTASRRIRALMVNSGCANAATGPEGARRATASCAALAHALDIASDEVLVNSTGVIGVHLPIERIERAIPDLVRELADGSCECFARAIMTTDTRPKWATRVVRWTDGAQERTCTVTGVAKGAGMIHPDMATMICAITTDAAVSPTDLDKMLRHAVDRSFHRISVDGDTSTNDSVFALASGAAGAAPEVPLTQAITEVAHELALMVVRDGEGFERGIDVTVTGAATPSDALTVAKTVAISLLVRTAVTGGDPNWGRILAAAGRAGVAFDPKVICVRAGGAPLFERGAPAETSRDVVRAAFTASTVEIEIDLAMGSGSDRFHSCGLTSRYVELNADYTT